MRAHKGKQPTPDPTPTSQGQHPAPFHGTVEPMTIPGVIHRAELPIDDRPHGIDLVGDLLHAAVRRPGAVDVWYLARRNPWINHARRSFQIVATGQPLPPHLGRHHATAISPDGTLVWHVLENICTHTSKPGGTPEQVPGVCEGCQVHITSDPTHG